MAREDVRDDDVRRGERRVHVADVDAEVGRDVRARLLREQRRTFPCARCGCRWGTVDGHGNCCTRTGIGSIPATSSGVRTAATSGCARAALASIERTRAWGYGLRRIAACRVPGTFQSAT